ncbi:MAG: hypothetical protein ACJZ9F_06100 [Rhodospirillaceae bacterium]
MITQLKTTLLAVIILFGDSPDGFAQDLVTASEAYKSGDYATALKEWRLLAEQGNSEAQFRLSWMYYDGTGVVQDKVYAHMWVNLAAANAATLEYHDIVREVIAFSSRNRFAREMTPSQIEKAMDLARECVKKEYKGC